MRFGLSAVLLGGVLQGSVSAPDEVNPTLAMGKYLGVFFSSCLSFVSVVACVSLGSSFPTNVRDVAPRVLVATLLFGAGMGGGALMMGLAYRYVGMAITFAIVLGISSTVGTLVPMMVLAPDQVMQHRGLMVILGMVIALIGTCVVTWAAWERDSKKEKASTEDKSNS